MSLFTQHEIERLRDIEHEVQMSDPNSDIIFVLKLLARYDAGQKYSDDRLLTRQAHTRLGTESLM